MHSGRARDKSEVDLCEHVKKALSPAETAPKQKHVRSCIVFTWDYQTSQPVWTAIRMQPVLSDQVVCYKALITLHKLLVAGPHIVLGEALGERSFFDNCLRLHGGMTLGYGYGPLITAYVEFILAKLEFHRTHPEFTGNFDYEEYLSLKGVANLDEGYQTIGELMDLQEHVDRFQRTVFVNVRPMAQNECRIASLVPLIEESYGIYKFITSMLTAMHLCVESSDPLIPLVERYNQQFFALKKFYTECMTLRYLTSLIDIPKLPDQPPSFEIGPPGPRQTAIKAPPPKAEPREMPKTLEKDVDLLGDFGESDDAINGAAAKNSSNSREQINTVTHTVTTVPVVDEQMMAALRQAQFQNQQLAAQVQQLTDQLHQSLTRSHQDQGLLQQYHEQLTQAQEQLQALSLQPIREDQSTEVATLRAEVDLWKARYEAMAKECAKWKAKYEGMAALYQQLRTDHADLLGKFKDLQQQAARDEEVKLAQIAEENQKQADMASALGDRLAEELLKVTQAIEAAAARLDAMRNDPALSRLSSLNASVHEAIVEGTAVITSAIGNLIKYAIQTQAEIVAAGKGSGTPDAFYRKHSEWTNGLISAAQAVATATMTLVETADGVIKGKYSINHLVAASNSVAAATMQLVTASKVKAGLDSKAQPLLEQAAKAVTEANRRLVDSAANVAADGQTEAPMAPIPEDAFNRKREELERQARVLALEKELSSARGDLAHFRKAVYQPEKPSEHQSTSPVQQSASIPIIMDKTDLADNLASVSLDQEQPLEQSEESKAELMM